MFISLPAYDSKEGMTGNDLGAGKGRNRMAAAEAVRNLCLVQVHGSLWHWRPRQGHVRCARADEVQPGSRRARARVPLLQENPCVLSVAQNAG